jgi:phytoene dehydrogenase-like protein
MQKIFLLSQTPLAGFLLPGVFSLLAATELNDGVWYRVGDFGKVGEALAQVG